MIAGRLTMRAAIERNVNAAADGWGQPGPPEFQSIGDPLPCFVWSERTSDIVDGKKSALIGDFRGLFALGADIRENDEIASVTDRAGTEIVAGRLQVKGKPEPKHNHIEVTLERVS